MRKINELKAGALLSYVNLAISCIIPLLYTPLMLRILGQSEYGLYSLSNSVISYLTMINFGMGSAVIRYVAKARVEGGKEQVEKIVGLFATIYIILALLVIIVGCILTVFADTWFAQGLTQDEIDRLRVLMVIMSLSTAVSFPVSVYSSLAVAYEKYIFRRVFDMVATIASPVLNLVVLFMGKGSIGMALVGLFIQIAYTPIFIGYCTKKLNIHPRFKNLPFNMLRDIWSFSAFVFLSTIVDMLYWSTDKVLIGALMGSASVAIYNVGGVFTSMLQQMSSAISNVFTPRVTMMVVKDATSKELSDLLIRIGRLQYLIVSFILSGYIVFGRIFIHFWSGDAYQDAYVVALLTMIPLAIPLIQNIAFNIILAQKKHQFRSIIYTVIAVINVITTYFTIPRFGIIGAAACTALSFVLGNGLIMNVYYYRVTRLNIPLFWKNIIRMTIIPLLFVVTGHFIVNELLPITGIVQFLIQVIVYSIFYMLFTWFFTMNTYEKNLFSDLLKRAIPFLKKVDLE